MHRLARSLSAQLAPRVLASLLAAALLPAAALADVATPDGAAESPVLAPLVLADAPDADDAPAADEAPEASVEPLGEPVVLSGGGAGSDPADEEPKEWGASVSLSATSVPAGSLVVVTPRVSGADAAGFTYNYVWQRDGWADWDSTVRQTGSQTSDASFSFRPTKAGVYTLMIDVTSPEGRTVIATPATLTVSAPAWTAEASCTAASSQVNEALSVTVELSTADPGFTYNFGWQRDGWAEWDSTVRSGMGAISTPSWTFTPTVAGTYSLFVDVIDAYGASRTLNAGTVEVEEPAWTFDASVSLDKMQIGQGITLSAAVSGIDTTGFTYNYVWNYEGKWVEWGSTVSQTGSNTTSATYDFKPSRVGDYILYVDAVSPSGTVHTDTCRITVTEPLWNASVSLSAPALTLGQSVAIAPVVTGADASKSFTYNYVWNYEGAWNEWGSTVGTTGSRTSAATHTFTPAKSGEYVISIDVVDELGAIRTVENTLVVEHDFDYSRVAFSDNLVRAGGSVVVTPQVSGNTEGLTYNYVWQRDGWADWDSTINRTGSATTDASWTFTPTEPGNYTLYVDVIGTDGVAETQSCELAVWELLGVKTRASGSTWTLSANLGISNPEDFGFKYNYVYNQGGAWQDWSSTLLEEGGMTSATSASYKFTKAGYYDVHIDVVSPDGESATASKTVMNYTGYELDMWGRINSLTSPTNYLIACDTSACVVGIYEKHNGDWVQIRRWTCTTGAWNTPTRTGLYEIESKGTSFDSYGVRCFWYSGYSGPYLFHSICYWPSGAVQDGRLGMHLSHGCIRLATANAKWIYDNIPYGTTVLVY